MKNASFASYNSFYILVAKIWNILRLKNIFCLQADFSEYSCASYANKNRESIFI